MTGMILIKFALEFVGIWIIAALFFALLLKMEKEKSFLIASIIALAITTYRGITYFQEYLTLG